MIIDEKAPLITRDEIFICSTPQEVWSVFTAINEWSEWNHDIVSAELISELKPGGTFNWDTAGIGMYATIDELIPGQKITWHGLVGGSISIHEWCFYQVPQGVFVQTTASWSGETISHNVALLRLVFGGLIGAWLVRLKNRVEAKRIVLINSC